MVQKKDNQSSTNQNRDFNKLYFGVILFLLIQIAIYYQLTSLLK